MKKLFKSKIAALIIALMMAFAMIGCGETEEIADEYIEEENLDVEADEESETLIEEEETSIKEQEDNVSSNETTDESQHSEKEETTVQGEPSKLSEESEISIINIPAYSGTDYVALNNNEPNFDTENLSAVSYEYYSELDSLGRCGVAHACIGIDLMPTEERGSIGQVKPTGWQTVKYDIVDGKYLYNRCHLIGYQLSGENANDRNLITGTRQMNVDGMLPFENMVADYVKETENHVMYRVTPVFDGDNLLAAGVQMEAYSIEDEGDGICFNVFVYNVQDSVEINYADGSNKLIEEMEPTQEIEEETQSEPETELPEADDKYAVNDKNGKIHAVGECSATGDGDNAMSSPTYFETYEEAEKYSAYIKPNLDERKCGNCFEICNLEENKTEENSASDEQNEEVMVWIPKSGSKYHSRSGCSNMKDPTQVTQEEAEEMGYEPCKRCH